MGVALAEEARRRGARVTLLAANLAVEPPHGVEVVQTPTADRLLHEALARADVDLVLMSAAVADYRPADASETQAREGRRAVDDPSSSRPRTWSRRWPRGGRTAR